MNQPSCEVDPDLLKLMVEAIPVPLFIIDDDLRILYANPMGIEMLCHDRKVLINRRCGEVFYCTHSLETEGGCGRDKHCRDCAIRRAVKEACATGGVSRGMAHINRAAWVTDAYTHCLVTASGFTWNGRRLATLTLQDVPEFVERSGLVPICAWCRKVRAPEGEWQSLEDYLSDQLRVGVTHGMCPDCAARLAAGDENT